MPRIILCLILTAAFSHDLTLLRELIDLPYPRAANTIEKERHESLFDRPNLRAKINDAKR